MEIKFLKAFNGDSIWISFSEDEAGLKNILIDGGTSTTYNYKDKNDGKIKDGDLKKLVNLLKTKTEKLDLVILTHIDDDHIDGFLKWFSKDAEALSYIQEIWFNSGRTIKKYLKDTKSKVTPLLFKESTTLTSVKQGIDFENYIKDNGIWNEIVVKEGDILAKDKLTFQILSPDNEKLKILLHEWEIKAPESTADTSRKDNYRIPLKKLIEEDTFEEDDDAYNGSSITFIMEFQSLKYLFLADSHPTAILKSLQNLGYNNENKLKVDLFKISHHGSKKNTSTELLSVIDTNKYVISTNGDTHAHPDKATIARIVNVNPKAKIYFNYSKLISKIILEEDRQEYPEVQFLDTDLL